MKNSLTVSNVYSNTKFNFRNLRGGVILFFVFNNFILSAQEQLFSYLNKKDENIIKSEFKSLLTIIKKESKYYDFIEVNRLSDNLINGDLKINLKNKVLNSRVKQLEYVSEDSFSYSGIILDPEQKEIGHFYLKSDFEGVYGQIMYEMKSFEILSLKNRSISIIQELSSNEVFRCDEKNEKNPITIEQNSEKRSLEACPNSIRVLFVYTQNALNCIGSTTTIYNRIQNAITGIHSANTNSGVSSGKGIIQFVGLESTTYIEHLRGFNATGDPTAKYTLFNNLRNATQTRKHQLKADVVICIGDHNNPISDGNVYQITNQSNVHDTSTYAIVEGDKMHNLPILQHEMGHFLGGRHSSDPTQSNSSCHGFDYVVNGIKKATIMSTTFENHQRPNRWSSSTMLDGGVSTGNTNFSNMAHHIGLNSDALSSISNNNILFSYISGPENVSSIGNQSYEVNFGCSNGHTFQWYKSNDGFNYNITLGNNINHVQFFTPGMGGTLYLKCIVTGSDGQTSTCYKTTSIYIPYYQLRSDLTQAIEIKLFENPVQNDLIFEIPIDEKQIKSIQVISSLGSRLVHRYRESIVNNNSGKLDVSLLQQGIYLLTIETNNEMFTKIFIKK